MSLTSGASAVASRRIRTFSIVVSIFGAMATVGIGLASVASAFLGYGPGFGYDDEYDSPWAEENPIVAETSDGGTTWSAAESGVIHLDWASYNHRPLLIETTSEEYFTVFVDDPNSDVTGVESWPLLMGIMREGYPGIVIPTTESFDIWLTAEGAWSVTITPLEGEALVDRASGTTEQYLVYEGTASSARFQYQAEHGVFVDMYTPEGRESVNSEADEGDRRISWPPYPMIVLLITTYSDESSWSIDIDELATVGPTTTVSPTGEPQ